MITVICCFRNLERWTQIKANIKDTSSLALQFIGINNADNSHSLPEAYNYGIENANQPILCFMHDDVDFIANGWDKLIISTFEKNESIGVIGCAGGTNVFCAPSTWWTNKPRYNSVVQNYVSSEGFHETVHSNSIIDSRVIGVDGFLFFVKLKDLKEFRFSTTIGKWHGYDLDISYHMHFRKRLNNTIVSKPIATHYSTGNYNVGWAKAMIKIWGKYSEHTRKLSTVLPDFQATIFFLSKMAQAPCIKKEIIKCSKSMQLPWPYAQGIKCYQVTNKIRNILGRLLILIALYRCRKS